MKTKAVVLILFAGTIFLLFGHDSSLAWSKKKAKEKSISLKIGTVSIHRVFKDCKKVVKYRQQTMDERDKLLAELEKLSKEIEADRAGLKTLKEGSSDYMDRIKSIMEKQARLQAQEDFHKQHLALKEQRITEELYQDILRQTQNVAKQNGFDLVFERSEPEFPSTNNNELVMTISSHKLLYSDGCQDITDVVIAALDAGN
jgi:Skp family chaperone for outer membrane proteins